MQFIMTLFRALLSSKTVALIGFLGAILGAISDPQWGTVIPTNLAGWAVTIGAPLAWLGRQLVDVDGNGIPDFIDSVLARFKGGTGGAARLQLLVVTSLAAGTLLSLLLTAI